MKLKEAELIKQYFEKEQKLHSRIEQKEDEI